MYLVRTPQGEIKEGELEQGVELETPEIGALLAAEAANVELHNARLAEFPKMIAALEAKKLIFTDDAGIQSQIDKLTEELNYIPTQKAGAKALVTLYNKYV